MAILTDEGKAAEKDEHVAGKAIRVLPLDQDIDNAIAETAWLNNKLVFKNQPFGNWLPPSNAHMA